MCSQWGFDAHLTRIFFSYRVTKTMQLALTRGLAETTAGTAVTVNSVLFEKNSFGFSRCRNITWNYS